MDGFDELSKEVADLKALIEQPGTKEYKATEFKPPQIPIAWMSTTFIVPALVYFVPRILEAGEDSIEVLTVVSLALLSVLLFVLFLVTFQNNTPLRITRKSKSIS